MKFFLVFAALLIICQLATVVEGHPPAGCVFMACEKKKPVSNCQPGYVHYKHKWCGGIGGALTMKRQEICCPAAPGAPLPEQGPQGQPGPDYTE